MSSPSGAEPAPSGRDDPGRATDLREPGAPPPTPLLRQWNFSALWWGQLISILGERFTYLALVGLLAEHTHQFRDARASLLLTVLANVMLAPVLAFAPFTGAWVDRWNLKRVLVVSDLMRAVLVVLIPFVYAATQHTLPVFVLVFALFTCNVFFLPAKSAITPEIVPPSQLLAANALLVTAGIAATAAGALAGGWIIDHWGWTVALVVNSATYVVSVVALLAIRYRPEAHTASVARLSLRGYLSETAEGWKLVRANPTVALGLIALGATWMAGGFLHVAGNQHIQHAASLPGMERLGVLLCVLGLGAGLGTWAMNTRGRNWPRATSIAAGLAVAGAALVPFALSTRFGVFAIASFVLGIAAAPAFMLSETLLQQGTEARQRGRVFSARDFLMRLLFLIAVTVAGATSRWLGAPGALLVCAGLMVAAAAVAWAWGRRNPALTTG